MDYYGQNFAAASNNQMSSASASLAVAAQQISALPGAAGHLLPLQYHHHSQYQMPSNPVLQYQAAQSMQLLQGAGGVASKYLNDELLRNEDEKKRKLSAMSLMPPPTVHNIRESRKYAYKLSTMQDVYSWYLARQQFHLSVNGHRAVVENLIIYLEGLNVNYNGKDISITETIGWRGIPEFKGGPLQHESYRDNLSIDPSPGPKKTCSFIHDSVVNFLHTGTLASLCMIETISSYFIPIHSGTGLSASDIYEDRSQNIPNGVGFKKINGGYVPGECGTLSVRQDGTYSLKAYGIIIVIGLDFIAATCKHVHIERLTTSSIRLLHPNGVFQLPKHVLRYRNRPIAPELLLPNSTLTGTTVFMERVQC